ncbi:MAG: FAD-binding protein, partial [Dehalococcoidales bacterium]|nr:FAD-binding protein [Dehalococcoidales bacterium]
RTAPEINVDVLVIGGGIAGLRAAIAARRHDRDVLLVSESPVGLRNNSAISKATFAVTGVWKNPGDSPEVHFKDTITAGRLMNDRRLVTRMVDAVRQQVADLVEFGVQFRRRNAEISVVHTPGHTYPRNITAGDYRGINITRPMRQYAASIGVRFIEGVLVTRLLRTGGRVTGVLGVDSEGWLRVFGAKSTILATGGAGRIYLRTNNASGLTGDGYALAYEAGAVLRDMEFVQFYPAAWGKNGSQMCLYERLLPAGGVIRNALGDDILQRHGVSDIISATRDLLARLVMTEVIEGRGIDGGVVFDFTGIPEERARDYRRGGLMGPEDRLIVAPTVHFFMGGVKINGCAETGIDGLYAAGEVGGGIHGANRLGGNAISAALAFGTIAGDRAAALAGGMRPASVPPEEIVGETSRLKEITSTVGRESLNEVQPSLQQIMWDRVGVLRDGQHLADALNGILALRERLAKITAASYPEALRVIKLSSMLTVAEMVTRAAQLRTESRGAHYRTDYPREDSEHWLRTIEVFHHGGAMVLKTTPVPAETD